MKTKKTSALLFTLLLMITTLNSCKKSSNFPSETQDLIRESSNSFTSNSLKHLNVNKPLGQMSKEEYTLYRAARDRMDKYIELKHGQYYLLTTNYEDVGVTKEVFEHFKSIMIITNDNIRNLDIVPLANNKYILKNKSIKNSLRLLKTDSETGGGGIDSFQGDWSGFTLSLSYETLGKISNAGTVTAGVLAFIPEPSTVTKIVGACAGMCGIVFGFLKDDYPSGVVISAFYVAPGLCLPYSISSQ